MNPYALQRRAIAPATPSPRSASAIAGSGVPFRSFSQVSFNQDTIEAEQLICCGAIHHHLDLQCTAIGNRLANRLVGKWADRSYEVVSLGSLPMHIVAASRGWSRSK